MPRLRIDYDVAGIKAFDTKKEKLVEALVTRMTSLMTKLQARALENLDNSKSAKAKEATTGNLRASITNPAARVEGSNIIGTVDWGNNVPYAKIQEYGGIKEYAINPVEGVGEYKGGYAFGAYRAPHPARTGKKVLRFIGVRDGKVVFTPQVFRQALTGRFFMTDALNGMREEIKAGLKETIQGVIKG